MQVTKAKIGRPKKVVISPKQVSVNEACKVLKETLKSTDISVGVYPDEDKVTVTWFDDCMKVEFNEVEKVIESIKYIQSKQETNFW